jgi:hypothetical protein
MKVKVAKEPKVQKFEDYIYEACNVALALIERLDKLIEYKTVFESDIYRSKLEHAIFVSRMEQIISKSNLLLNKGGKPQERRKRV